jgi:hypothetical protein
MAFRGSRAWCQLLWSDPEGMKVRRGLSLRRAPLGHSSGTVAPLRDTPTAPKSVPLGAPGVHRTPDHAEPNHEDLTRD